MKKKVPSIRTGVQVNDPLYTILDLAKHNKDKTCSESTNYRLIID